jgi:hypothetical protein
MQSRKENATWLSSADLPSSAITHHRLVVVWVQSSAKLAVLQFPKYIQRAICIVGRIALQIALPAKCGLHREANLIPSLSGMTAGKWISSGLFGDFAHISLMMCRPSTSPNIVDQRRICRLRMYDRQNGTVLPSADLRTGHGEFQLAIVVGMQLVRDCASGHDHRKISIPGLWCSPKSRGHLGARGR